MIEDELIGKVARVLREAIHAIDTTQFRDAFNG